uniref:Uncharacterized protein n=1 Tax=Glossina austeni TaxID=7395 RepID=A0A1A9UHW4_GLOAU
MKFYFTTVKPSLAVDSSLAHNFGLTLYISILRFSINTVFLKMQQFSQNKELMQKIYFICCNKHVVQQANFTPIAPELPTVSYYFVLSSAAVNSNVSNRTF